MWLRSGGFPCIEMMQSPNLGNFDQPDQRERSDGSAHRCIFFEREMGSVSFEALEIVL